ncbi:MAG TPA: hypothetical protein VFP84_00550 [Kofleriaceae bacterium]|nr:hypothetical protein [Kofleriaceae bacterium]
MVLAACNNDGAAAKEPPPAPPPTLAGVYPDKWKCESIASLDALSAVLGGPVRPIDSPISVPSGVPRPCNYEVTVGEVSAPAPAGSGSQVADGAAQRGLEYWTFDVDCRDRMKERADALFAQYQKTSQDLIDAYAAAQAAAKAKPAKRKPGEPAAPGVDIAPPTPAVDVAVGAKGLDHHGQGLIFIDDDAPCYVRVVGRDAQRRLELARLLAKNLTFGNAPMTPRAAK